MNYFKGIDPLHRMAPEHSPTTSVDAASCFVQADLLRAWTSLEVPIVKRLMPNWAIEQSVSLAIDPIHPSTGNSGGNREYCQ
jgi:hypothetical protein